MGYFFNKIFKKEKNYDDIGQKKGCFLLLPYIIQTSRNILMIVITLSVVRGAYVPGDRHQHTYLEGVLFQAHFTSHLRLDSLPKRFMFGFCAILDMPKESIKT